MDLQLLAAPESKTNEASQAAVVYTSSAISLENPPEMDALRQNFINELATSDDIVFDRVLGPASQLSLIRQQTHQGYSSLQHFNSDGASMFAKIGMDSLRNAAVDAFPVDFWQEHALGWFADFVSGTLGNPQEEHIELTSVSYSAVRSSWERNGKDAGFQWGLRPWTTSPYIYFLVQAGHFNRRSLLTLETRAGYNVFGSSKIEGRLTLQLPGSFRIAGSAAMDPRRVGSGEPGSTFFGITLERLIGQAGRNPDSVFYVGFRSGIREDSSNPRHDNMIVAGLFRRL